MLLICRLQLENQMSYLAGGTDTRRECLITAPRLDALFLARSARADRGTEASW